MKNLAMCSSTLHKRDRRTADESIALALCTALPCGKKSRTLHDGAVASGSKQQSACLTGQIRRYYHHKAQRHRFIGSRAKVPETAAIENKSDCPVGTGTRQQARRTVTVEMQLIRYEYLV